MSKEKDIHGETEASVTKKANDLVSRLNKHYGVTSWKAHVWWNLHWCWDVRAGGLNVSKHTDAAGVPYYMAMLSSGGGSGADAIWFTDRECTKKEPEDVIDSALDYAQAVVDKYQTTIDNTRTILGW